MLRGMETPELGPLAVFYGWQSVVLAILVSMLTAGVKRGLDAAMGGAEKRKASLPVSQLLLPATPIIIGALVAVLVPVHPEVLTDYVAAKAFTGFKAYAVLAAYGACVGQFSDYLWSRYSGFIGAAKPAGDGEKPATSEAPKA